MTLRANYIAFVTLIQISALFLSGLVQAQNRPQPEISTDVQNSALVTAQKFMITTANPYATKAGYDILARGGTATDAAITAQLVLGLVEPQSSGLGGGAFALYYDAKGQKLRSYDARETAPFLAGPFHFYKNGEPMKWQDAVLGGRSVGVPALPSLIQDLHEMYGKLTWMELFTPAIKLAEEGFIVSPRMAKMVAVHADRFRRFPETAAYFLPEDVPVTAGYNLKNTAYAKTLKDLSFYGTNRFYKGQTAQRIIDKVQNIKDNPGLLTIRDFEEYKVKERDPVCAFYRGKKVCSMGEPSSGGLTLLQILGMLESYDLPAWGVNSPKSWHTITEASRLAFADRGRYMADPDFVNTPGMALLDPSYIKSRAALIQTDKAQKQVEPGKPSLWNGPLYDEGNALDRPGTTHISIIDKYGNALSMTSTIESAFGSHLMVDGFLLNNQLTDFSFSPIGKDGKTLVANMVEGGKRPRSSMSPTIVFDENDKPILIIGSAGGSRIIGYVLQSLISILDWNIPVDKALAMPHILNRGAVTEMEDDTYSTALKIKGHKVKIAPLNSGLTAIHVTDKAITAAADPRREGIGMGD